MLDLNLLETSAVRAGQSSGTLRLALLHYGFRTTQLGLMDKRTVQFSPRHASLGLLNLARALEVDFAAGLLPVAPEFRYFDEDCFVTDEALADAIDQWLAPASARFVLVGLYSLAFERTNQFLGGFDEKRHCIIVGGAHPTVSPAIDNAHIAVRGEGAAALRHVVTSLGTADFGQGADARGVCYMRGGVEHIAKPAFDRSLATTPAPAFRYELFAETLAPGQTQSVRWWEAVGTNPQIYVCTQSCRARCTFCSTYLIHGNLTCRPLALVREDLAQIVALGHDSVKFHDDDLLQHDELEGLFDALGESGLTWSCNARSEYVTPALARRMHQAGCRRVFLGVESLNQDTLDYFRKATTVEENQRAVRCLDDAGIGVISGFIIGSPHDTRESILADLDRMLELPVYFLSTAILTPDIGTVEFQRARKTVPDLGALTEHGRNDIRPRPDLFGAEAPYGLPTVCPAVDKHGLNELYQLVGCAFFLRRSAMERVRRHTMPGREDEIATWYEWISDQTVTLAERATEPSIRAHARRILEGASALTGFTEVQTVAMEE